MIKILICDDNPIFLEGFSQRLMREFDVWKVPLRIELFASGEAVLGRMAKGPVDAVFLDVEMGGISGLEAAKIISRSYPKVLLFFVSSQEKYVYESIKYRPFRYVRKSRLAEELPELVAAYVKELQSKTVEIRFAGSKSVTTFVVQNICFVESEGNYLIFHLEEGNTRLRGTLTMAEKKLSVHNFVRCSSNCVINCRKIREIRRDEAELENGMLVPISRPKLEAVRTGFSAVLRGLI